MIRADHVGSLLRPKALLDVRAAFERGALGAAELEAAEDEAIAGVLALQKGAGVDVFSDGEFRRLSWASGFHDAAEGLERGELHAMARAWKGPAEATANEDLPIASLVATGRVRVKGRIAGREARFLAAHAPGPFKITMPGPSMYMNLWDERRSRAAYPERQGLLDDLVEIYRAEVKALAADGAAYIQLDSLRYMYVIANRPVAQAGAPLDQILEETLASDNAVLSVAKAAGATTAIHICRGNHRSAWVSEGGYDPVAERLFNETAAERLLLEFDDERSGGFEPLRYVPKGKTVVLGLITTKSPRLEDRDMLRRRIDEAARYVDLDDLALSPQCGFASTHLGNLLTEDDERRKLELVAETARAVWG
jgi:5-methyltetrahydropteroyltriglutamate--homocysteine methyltransferase